MRIIEPARGRNRARYQAAIDAALAQWSGFQAQNPTRAVELRIRWYSRDVGYAVQAGFRDRFTGGFVPVCLAFSH